MPPVRCRCMRQPWRERPPSCARCLTPGAPRGSFTPRLRLSESDRCGARCRHCSSTRLPRFVAEPSTHDSLEMHAQICPCFPLQRPADCHDDCDSTVAENGEQSLGRTPSRRRRNMRRMIAIFPKTELHATQAARDRRDT